MQVQKVATDKQQEDAFQVRNTVFVGEQNVPPEIEIDELENESIHFVGYEGDQPVAAGRIRLVEGYGKLERVCVLKEYRGRQFGKEILAEMEKAIQSEGYNKAKLNAQTHAEKFYESLGYQTVSDEFMDAGIPHVTMIKDLS